MMEEDQSRKLFIFSRPYERSHLCYSVASVCCYCE